MRKDFIPSLLKVKNVNEHHQEIRHVARTAPSTLLPIFYEADQWKPTPIPWQIQSIREYIITEFSLNPGEEYIHCLFEILPSVTKDDTLRQIANMLAFSQDIEVLTNYMVAIAETLSTEFILLVAHELITCGNDLEPYREFYQLLQRLNPNSVFRPLTLYPLEIEKTLPQRYYSSNTVSSPLPAKSDSGTHTFKGMITASEIVTWKTETKIIKCVQKWKDHSNGRMIGIKGKTQNINSESALLYEIICRIEGIDVNTCQYIINSRTKNEIFTSLFTASASGGAYDRGEYNAYGRLAAWESLHAMVDDGNFVSNIATERLVQEYEWYEFLLDQWYDYIAWDIGILGINRTTQNFCCLMATDTD